MRVKYLLMISIFIGLASLNVFADDLSSCMKILNSKERLACFEQLAKSDETPLKKVEKMKEPKEESLSQPPLAKSEEAKQIDEFSSEDLKKTDIDKGPDSINANISNLKKMIRGQWIIYLENGQKWQQTDSGKLKLKVDDSVRLKKGAMGAVYLFKEGSSRNIRVKRLK